ncbi:MAG: lipopolysaccharide assembly protein LapA domain-containing protein [Thermosynechococcaceae cyanobacterium]
MPFLLLCLIGLAIPATAILSVQNASAITIQFLFWQSVPLPLGLVLAFALSSGLLLVAGLRPIMKSTTAPSRDRNIFDLED